MGIKSDIGKRDLARRMRLNPTAAEFKFWQAVRGKSLGVRTHRQKIKRGYILDFYVPKLGLAIEIDGPEHDPKKDAQRSAHLLKSGIRTIRFTDSFVMENKLHILVAAIVAAFKNLEGKGSEAGS